MSQQQPFASKVADLIRTATLLLMISGFFYAMFFGIPRIANKREINSAHLSDLKELKAIHPKLVGELVAEAIKSDGFVSYKEYDEIVDKTRKVDKANQYKTLIDE